MAADRELRSLAAAVYGWAAPPFKLWASVRVYELGKGGETATVIIWFNRQAFDARDLERAGEPEYAVRRASGAVERSPHAPPPAPPAPLRVVHRKVG
jgi:hypothetical protein